MSPAEDPSTGAAQARAIAEGHGATELAHLEASPLLTRAGLAFTLSAAMVLGVFGRVAFGVLSPLLIGELSLNRAQIGYLVSAYSLTGAVLSPVGGWLADRIGGKRSLVVLFVLAGIGLIGIALGISYPLLIVASTVAGVAQSVANPSTNKVIAHNVPPGKRGMLTGIKQSAVQLGVVLAGLVVPVGAASIGWRPTFALGALAAWLLAASTLVFLPADEGASWAKAAPMSRVPTDAWWLASLGLSMGVVGGALLTYLPLYAEERVGFSVALAGAAAAVMGGVGFLGRITWGHFSERLSHYGRAIAALSLVSMLACGVMWGAESWGGRWIWIGAGLAGASVQSWMAVGMLATIATAESSAAGRASGIVVLGFLAGHTIGPPGFGLIVDATNDYAPAFGCIAAVSLMAALLAGVWARRSGARMGGSGTAMGAEPTGRTVHEDG